MLELQNISRTFGGVRVLNNFSLSVKAGEVVAVRGPSGCGKSTLLRTIAFEPPESGLITLAGQEISTIDPYQRQIAMLFQSAAEAMPEKTVAGMLTFALHKRNDKDMSSHPTARFYRVWQRILMRPKPDAEMLHALLDQVRLPPEKLLQRLGSLSGGERQRAMLARVLAEQPLLLLADEPLANLDYELRFELAREMRRFFKETGMTVLYVTHDPEEAVIVSDRVIDYASFQH